MKLAVITTYATPRNMRRELLERVRRGGHDLVLIAPDAPGMAGALTDLGGTFRPWAIERTGISPVPDARAAAALYRILRAEQPDVVLLYQIKAVLVGPAMATLARVPRIVALVNGLGAVFDEDGFGRTRKAQVARLVYALSLRAVDEIVFQNADDPAYLERAHLLSPRARRRIIAGSGVDLEKFRPVETRPGVLTFTLVSRLIASKGIRELVAAARRVRVRFPDVRVRLVGRVEESNHPDSLSESELAGWVAEGIVAHTGFVDDVRPILRDTSVFVLPSYYREGVPRTNLEALAMALPVITTNWVGCRDTVEDGRNGFLIPPRDIDALVDRMERYARDPSLIATHGRAGRLLAERRFDAVAVTEQLVEALGLVAETDASARAGSAARTNGRP